MHSIIIIHPRFKGIGGVKTFVDRLKKLLIESDSICYNFYSCFNRQVFSFRRKKIILQVSNPIPALVLSFFLFFSNSDRVAIYHFNIERFKFIKRYCVKIISYLSCKSVFLNDESFNWASRNKIKNIVKCSVFIPPNNLNFKFKNKLKNNLVFCTNAYGYNFDKDGNEIYGIFSIIKIFKELKNHKLIISDSNDSYGEFLRQNKLELPKNITLKSYKHDFIETLYHSDVFIRYNSTDGDSISIHEALMLKKIVIASNVVSRPNSNNLYLVDLKIHELRKLINKLIDKKISFKIDKNYQNSVLKNIEKLKKEILN